MSAYKKKILVVDDDRLFLHIFYKALSDRGYYVVMQTSPEGAQDWMMSKEAGKFDMIITDQKMPGEKGSSFLSFLSELEKTDPQKINTSSETYRRVRERFANLTDTEFLTFLKNLKIYPNIRVIMSGYSKDVAVDRALEAGVIHKFISKDTPIPEILGMIDKLLAS